MPSPRPAAERGSARGQLLPLLAAVALLSPAVCARLIGWEPSALLAVALYFAAFVGAALLLAWGTELAQLDLPPGLAVLILALVAILPEYAIDLLFAYRAGKDPSRASLALANMTGANRLLIGLGWSLVVLMGALGARKRRDAYSREPKPPPGEGEPGGTAYGSHDTLALSRRSAVDVFVLAVVSVYTLTFCLRQTLTLLDSLVLFVAFGLYALRLWTAPKQDPELIGPPAYFARRTPALRRLAMGLILLAAAASIFACARPLADALVQAGKTLGVDEFLMVQWVAPFATESAELVAAAIFAYRQKPDEGLGTLLSSKVNQWTLLVGGVPIAFAISSGGFAGLPIDDTQRQELLLTAAQSVFAVSLIADDLRLGTREASAILLIFAADLITSVTLDPSLRAWARYGFSGLYLVLSIGTLLRARRHLPELTRNAVTVPLRELDAREHPPVR